MRKRKQIGLRAMSTILAAVLLMAGMSTANLPIRDMSVSAKTLAELQDERQANESKIAEKQKKLDSLQSNMNENEQYQKTLKEKIALQQENLDIVSEELKRIGTSISETEDAIAQAEDDITVMERISPLVWTSSKCVCVQCTYRAMTVWHLRWLAQPIFTTCSRSMS